MQKTLEAMGANLEVITLIEAVLASIIIIKQAKHSFRLSGSSDKSDGTIVTRTDFLSEKAGIAILKRLTLPIWSEERGRPKLMSGTSIVLYDPLDGTRFYKTGAGGVNVIASILDASGRVIICVVGEVDTGRIFFACTGYGTWVFYSYGQLLDDIKKARRCRVWAGKVKTGTVMFDITPGFTKEGFRPIPNPALGRLFASLFGEYRLLIGSNGINQALVALGREEVVGSITTALGGPWDVAPVLLILEAGGYAQGFRDGVPVDPLLAMEYNMLVTGSRRDIVQALSQRAMRLLY